MDNVDVREFYTNGFVKNPRWNTPYPNRDEATRAGKILLFVAQIAQEYYSQSNIPMEILDVGCGRGWLTSLLSSFGHFTGLEPVPEVVAYARSLFPSLEFVVSTPENYIANQAFKTFDLIICSEVIEHVHHDEQFQFLFDLSRLLKPKGCLVLTTPRGELFDVWNKTVPTKQPVEDWLSEEHLDKLIGDCELEIVKRDRCSPTNLYTHYFKWLHKRPFRQLMSYLGYQDATPWMGMIYQVVWLKKFSC